MDKTILGAGIALVALGIGFLVVKAIDPSLHQAFTTGGYLWMIVGGATTLFALKTKSEKQVVSNLRLGAI